MSKEEEMIIVLLKEKEKLKEEISNLKDTIEKIDNQRAFYSIKNMDKKDRIDKAIELLSNDYEMCNSALTNPEHTITSKHRLLEIERNTLKKVIEILKGKE